MARCNHFVLTEKDLLMLVLDETENQRVNFDQITSTNVRKASPRSPPEICGWVFRAESEALSLHVMAN